MIYKDRINKKMIKTLRKKFKCFFDPWIKTYKSLSKNEKVLLGFLKRAVIFMITVCFIGPLIGKSLSWLSWILVDSHFHKRLYDNVQPILEAMKTLKKKPP